MHTATHDTHLVRPNHFPFIRNICILLQIDFAEQQQHAARSEAGFNQIEIGQYHQSQAA